MHYGKVAGRLVLAGLLAMTLGKTARADGFVGIYTGESFTRGGDLHITQAADGTDATFHGVKYKGRPFTGSIYYGIRAGTYFKNTPHLGVEFNFNHYKVYARTNQSSRVTGTFDGQPVDETAVIGTRIQKFQITNGFNMLALNVLYRIPMHATPGYPNGRLQPYVGAGPTYYRLYPINIINNKYHDNGYEDGGFGYNLLGGIRYGLTPHFNAFAEIKYNHAVAHVDVADDGEARLDVFSAHTLLGVDYSF